jgi:hypothetical protein
MSAVAVAGAVFVVAGAVLTCSSREMVAVAVGEVVVIAEAVAVGEVVVIAEAVAVGEVVAVAVVSRSSGASVQLPTMTGTIVAQRRTATASASATASIVEQRRTATATASTPASATAPEAVSEHYRYRSAY